MLSMCTLYLGLFMKKSSFVTAILAATPTFHAEPKDEALLGTLNV